MAAHISKKTSWIRFLTSFLPSIGVAALLCILLEGPRLGFLFDFLLRQRPALPISRELLLIDSSISGSDFGDDILEPGAVTSLLYTMAELGARTLIIQVPILGLSAGSSVGEEQILYHFDEEFSILSKNIRNLFDAIRTGSVAPGESARFVGELVELSEKGKERLVSALVQRDEEGIVSMEKAAAFFGYARRPGDLRVQLIRAGEGGHPGVLAERDEYSRVPPDSDGILRRVLPVMTTYDLSVTGAGERTLEHIIYAALKPRYEKTSIEFTGSGTVLAALNGPDGKDRIIPLDRSGALIFEVPHKGEDFRRIGISDFLAYDEADRSLKRHLLEAEALNIFSEIEVEDHPGILYDYALSLLEEPASSFHNGNEEKKYAWVNARNMYFQKLEDFLYGPTEMNLISNFEEEMQNSLMQTFVGIRAKHSEVLELREKLETSLSSSFCILGNSSDVEASALLANSILTGRATKPGEKNYLLLGALVSALLVCFFIKSQNPTPTLGTGILLSLLIGAGFSVSFIIFGLWLDPLVPLAATFTGVMFSFTWALISKGRYNRHFCLAYGPYVSRPCLKSVIRAGGPIPSQIITVRAATVAVRGISLYTAGNSPAQRALQVILFHEKVSDLLMKAGGTITGTEEDMVIACFGSPLERIFMSSKKKASPYEGNIDANAAPALKAVDFVSEIVTRPELTSLHFGLDMGNCTFTWTALSGYIALGTSLQRARVLSRMAARYHTRIVISSSVNEALSDLPTKKLDVLKSQSGEEAFYKLTVGG